MAICSVCKRECGDVRIRTDAGAYGPVDVQTCRPCHELAMWERKQESKRTGFRLPVKRWQSLTARGEYSQVG